MRRILAVSILMLGCSGGSQVPSEQLFANLRRAMEAPVGDQGEAASHSRTVQDVIDADALYGKRRFEVEEAIGRGDPCSRHPRCGEHGFEGDDWFYNVGGMGQGFAGPVPLLIVGFDREGKVARVWNLRLHEQ